MNENGFADIFILSFDCSSPAVSLCENKIIRMNYHEVFVRTLRSNEKFFTDPVNVASEPNTRAVESVPFGNLQILCNYLELLIIRMIQNNTDFFQRDNGTQDLTRMQNESVTAELIRQKLCNNIYSSLNLDDLARELNFSKSYLTKIFKKQTGRTIMDYYLKMKIVEAKRLIGESSLSLTEISAKLGFYSLNYFSSFFKRKTGMAPSEYKKSILS